MLIPVPTIYSESHQKHSCLLHSSIKLLGEEHFKNVIDKFQVVEIYLQFSTILGPIGVPTWASEG